MWLVRPLLATGEPVSITRLAAQAGRTENEIREALAAMPDTEYDAEGRIIGLGLTFNPPRTGTRRVAVPSIPGARWTPSPSPPSSATPPA